MTFSRLSNTCEIEICLGFEVSQDIDKSKPNVKQTIEAALTGRCSSKMIAILNELDEVWSIDPGSRVLEFSQYLGCLDLLYTSMRKRNIDVFRMVRVLPVFPQNIPLSIILRMTYFIGKYTRIWGMFWWNTMLLQNADQLRQQQGKINQEMRINIKTVKTVT